MTSFSRFMVTGLLVFVVSGCVKISTESGGVEQRQQTAEIRARDMRVEWATFTSAASPAELGSRLAELIRQAGAMYQDFGRQIAYNWRQGNEGRGFPVSDEEMQQQVPGWVEGEEPVLKAYDDMVDLAVDRMRREDMYDRLTMERVSDLVGHFDRLYSTVIYPKGTVSDYEFEVSTLVSRIGTLADEVAAETERFQ